MPTKEQVDDVVAALEAAGLSEKAETVKSLYNRALRYKTQSTAYLMALGRPVNVNVYTNGAAAVEEPDQP